MSKNTNLTSKLNCSFHVGLKPSAEEVRTLLFLMDAMTNGRTLEPFKAVKN